jgi:hypothetical protein
VRSHLTVDSGGSPRALQAPALAHQASFAISDTMASPGPSAPAAVVNDYFPRDHKAPLEEAIRGRLGLHEQDDAFSEESEPDSDDRFVNFALLSHLAVRLRDNVPRGTHVKGNIPYQRAFTGKDIVVRSAQVYEGLRLTARSRRSRRRSSASCSSRTASARTTGAPRCRSRGACRASCSSTRSSGRAGCCRTPSRTCTCSSTTWAPTARTRARRTSRSCPAASFCA